MSDLREQLAAAMAGTADEGETPPVIAPEAPLTVEAAAPGEAAPETANEQMGDKPAGAVERDEHGRFAPKESKAAPETPPAAEVKTETAAGAEPEPQATETIRVPHALPAPLKAEFKELPEKWRDAFVRQEDSIKAFKDEQAPKAARLNRFDEITGPQLDKWRLNGLDEFSAIQTLISAQAFLERNPIEGLQHLARSYGVNLHALAQQAVDQRPGQEGQAAPTVPGLETVLTPLVEQVRTLQQHFERQTQSTEAANLAEARSEVAQFASKPENMYFENVKDDVVRRLQSGAAATLAEAYEQATWASPEIRPLLLRAQAPAPVVDTAKKDAEAAQRKKADAARNAAGSVTGAPAPGAKAPQGPTGSVRDTLMAAMQEHGANV